MIMQLFKKLLVFHSVIFMSLTACTQKQSFDVLSYAAPKGWQQQQQESSVQLSVSDSKTGAYALALITKATASNAGAADNFKTDWDKLVKASVQVNDAPAMQEPVTEKGWDIISGTANYTDNAQNGLATLLTATGGGQMVSVVLMTNTQQYEKDLLGFINSLELTDAQEKRNTNITTSTTNNSSIVGLWVRYTIETSGYSNGFPQPSGGYFRKEYAFYGDGTYLFRMKNWAVFVKEIEFVYESGNWKLNGNQLTITPRQGKGGWWSKAASNRTSEWGSLVRYGSWKLEPVTYTVDLHYFSGSNETQLMLTAPSQTERDGKQDNNTFSFAPRALDKSLIDNPPGLKTGFERKVLNTPAAKTN